MNSDSSSEHELTEEGKVVDNRHDESGCTPDQLMSAIVHLRVDIFSHYLDGHKDIIEADYNGTNILYYVLSQLNYSTDSEIQSTNSELELTADQQEEVIMHVTNMMEYQDVEATQNAIGQVCNSEGFVPATCNLTLMPLNRYSFSPPYDYKNAIRIIRLVCIVGNIMYHYPHLITDDVINLAYHLNIRPIIKMMIGHKSKYVYKRHHKLIEELKRPSNVAGLVSIAMNYISGDQLPPLEELVAGITNTYRRELIIDEMVYGEDPNRCIFCKLTHTNNQIKSTCSCQFTAHTQCIDDDTCIFCGEELGVVIWRHPGVNNKRRFYPKSHVYPHPTMGYYLVPTEINHRLHLSIAFGQVQMVSEILDSMNSEQFSNYIEWEASLPNCDCPSVVEVQGQYGKYNGVVQMPEYRRILVDRNRLMDRLYSGLNREDDGDLFELIENLLNSK